MSEITNTQTDKGEMEMMFLLTKIVGSDAIEMQESQRQRELVNSSSLPTDGIESVRRMIESNGGQILDLVEGDPIFTNVILPEGWSKERTSHSMHSSLLSENGYKRAGIFYKAAFYDRSAHIRATRRLDVNAYGHDVEGEVKVSVEDAKGEVVFSRDVVTVEDGKTWEIRESEVNHAEAWLNENYPDWKDSNAYWN